MTQLPTVIAGPCVMESYGLMLDVGQHMKELTRRLGFKYVFKSSFEKANRSSLDSFRGPGLADGLALLDRLKSEINVQTTTDIHEASQAETVSKVADIIQIPALLSRQTPLIVAAAETGKVVNVKRGQFIAPNRVGMILEKIRSVSDRPVIITERGSFNGYEDLVVDFRTLSEARLAGALAGFDATHSVQTPASRVSESGGNPEYIWPFARAAAAIGVDYLFFETHPEPTRALSDGACMLPLDQIEAVLHDVKQLCLALS